jgi:hypothetical protein
MIHNVGIDGGTLTDNSVTVPDGTLSDLWNVGLLILSLTKATRRRKTIPQLPTNDVDNVDDV